MEGADEGVRTEDVCPYLDSEFEGEGEEGVGWGVDCLGGVSGG